MNPVQANEMNDGQSNFTLTSSNMLKNETPRLTTFNLSTSSFDFLEGSQLKTGRSISSSVISDSSKVPLASTLTCGYADRHFQKQRHNFRSN